MAAQRVPIIVIEGHKKQFNSGGYLGLTYVFITTPFRKLQTHYWMLGASLLQTTLSKGGTQASQFFMS